MVNGLAYGGGLELTLLCDIVIASDKATFALPEGRRGIFPGTAIGKIHEILGKHKAMELMLTGEPIDAKEAEKIGLVNKVVPHDELKKAVVEMAEKLKAVAPLSHRTIKYLWKNKPKAWEHWREQLVELAFTEDAAEAARAFFEKRQPVWRGR
jgi:enoyl-CoA hydratase/carnithine racemase